MRSIRAWLGLAVSVLFLALLLRQVDLDETLDAFRGVDVRWLAPAAAVYAAALLVRSLRWHLVIRPSFDVRPRDSASLLLIGYAANNVLPVRAGEVVRAVLLQQRHGGSRMTALGTIVVERILDGLVLAGFLLGTIAFAGGNDAVRALAALMTAGFVAAAGVLVLLGARPHIAERLIAAVLRLAPAGPRARLHAWAASLALGMTTLRSAGGWLLVMAASVVTWTLEAGAYWLVGEAFGLGLEPWVYLAICAAANLAIAAPSTAGGIGPFEFFAREVAVFFGAGVAASTAYAIAVHAAIIVPVAIIGLGLLWRRHLGLGDVRRLEERAIEDEATAAGASTAGGGREGPYREGTGREGTERV